MSPLVDRIDQISQDAEQKVTALWDKTRRGLDRDVFVRRSASTVNKANARATVHADQSVAADLRRQTGKPVRPTGIRPFNDQRRLEGSVRKVITDKPKNARTPDEVHESRRDRLARLARNEPATAAQNTTHKAMQTQEAVGGWVRVLVGSGVCPLCRQWADGEVRSTKVSMNRHRGCRCMQRPVAKKAKKVKKGGAFFGLTPGKAGLAILATPGDELLVAGLLGRSGTQGRTSFLSGGRAAYRRLQFFERLLMAADPVTIARLKAQRELFLQAGRRVERNAREIALLDGTFVDHHDTFAFIDNLNASRYTKEEQQALWDYAGIHKTEAGWASKGPVSRYNDKLRRELAFTDGELDTMSLVDQAILRNRTPRDVRVYRGARIENEAVRRLQETQPGEVIARDRSYLFTGLTEARAMPHALPTRKGYALHPDYKSVLFEIDVPKGTPAMASPYGEGLAGGGKSMITLGQIPGLRHIVPQGLRRQSIGMRVPFLRYFNKEELVFGRNVPMRFVSSEVRADGVVVVRVRMADTALPRSPLPGMGIKAMAGKAKPVPNRIVSAKPTAVTKAVPRPVGVGPAMHPDLIEDDKLADTIRRQAQVPGFEDFVRRIAVAQRKPIMGRKTIADIVERMAVMMLDTANRSMAISPAAAKLHAGWYPFANKWLAALAKTNARSTAGTPSTITRLGTYAATAALSPGADWADNVAWAKRMIEIIANQDTIKVKREWITRRFDLATARWEESIRTVKKESYRQKLLANPPKLRKDLIGKRLIDLDEADLALVIRGWHDVEPTHQLGGHAGFGRPENTTRPQSTDNLVKAIKVLRDGSLANIDATLGGQKVRSFYNNLANPLEAVLLDVTGDSHHFGIANGIPWTSSGPYISSGSWNVTETPWSGSTGVGGTYPLVAEASRVAARRFNDLHDTNYLPDQFQSIAWEMWRAEYPSGLRTDSLLAALGKVRTARARGRISRAQEAAQVAEINRLFNTPTVDEILEWFGNDLAGEPRLTLTELRKARKRRAKGK